MFAMAPDEPRSALRRLRLGGRITLPPKALDAAIIFAPVGALVPLPLRAVRKGGTIGAAVLIPSASVAEPHQG